MVYRDAPGDMRTAELRSLVASEPELHEAARRLRFEQDGANEDVDRLGRDLAAAERDVDRARGGGLRSLFGRSRATCEVAVRALRDALEDATAHLDELVAQEGTIRAQLEAIAAARAELAAREASARDALRSSDSPAGADFRAVDAAIAREVARVAALEVVLRAVEHADVAIAAVVQVAHDAEEADARPHGGVIGLAVALEHAGVLGARATDVVAYAKDRLRQLSTEIERLATTDPALAARLPRGDVDAYVVAPVPLTNVEGSLLVTRAPWLARALSAMLTVVAAERDRLRARCAELEGRQRDAAAHYLGGDRPRSEVA